MNIVEIGKKLLKKVSFNSNINNTRSKKNLRNRISLKTRNDHVTYETGRKILRDSQVATGFDILKYILSSKEWILTASENDNDNTIHDFIQDMLNNMDTELNETVKQQLTSLLWGFSIHEQIYDINNDGKLILKNNIPIHIKTLQKEPFTYNKKGELTSIHQEYDRESLDIPIDKVLKYSFNALYDEDYGNGLLDDFKQIVEDKMNINDWLMSFIEQHENPTVYGKTDNPISRDAILNGIDDLSGGNSRIVVGVNDELDVLESSHRGETFFQALQYKDNEIFRRYYLGNLLLGDTSQTGSYAQSYTQLEFGKIVFDGILEEIANVWQKQVINRIVTWNTGDTSLAPTIRFDKFTTGDLKRLFDIINPLLQNGTIDPENKTVQDSIGLLFKTETGLTYTPEETDLSGLNEDFNLNTTPVDVTEPESGQTEIIKLFDEVANG